MADPPAPAPTEEDSEEGVDLQYVKDVARLLLAAPRRHRRIAVVVFATIATLALAAAAFLPRTYDVDVMILTQNALALPTLVNPNRPRDANEAPTRAVEELIRKHDNIVAVVKDTNLLDLRDSRRAPIMRLKDKLSASLGGKPSETDRIEAMVGLLEQRLLVTSDGTTIHVHLDWDDPQIALLLVNTIVGNFLEGRNAADVAVVAETINILEAEAKKAGDDVDAAMSNVLHLEQDLHKGVAPPPASATAKPPATGGVPQPLPTPAPTPAPFKKSNLSAQLAEKRRQIRELDEPRQRKIAELKAELAELKLTYAPAHPSVIAAEKKLADASVEPPELVKLKQEEQALLDGSDDVPSEYDESAPPKPNLYKPTIAPKPTITAEPQFPKDDPPELSQAKSQLSAAAKKYNELLDRVDAARIEMLTAQAAFKYRYSISQPAQLPRKPKKPNVPVLVVGGLLGAAILAILAATARDLAGGRFLEEWQVKRRLKLPVLARVKAR